MRTLRAALVTLGAVVLTAGCAAGQNAQTANEKPSLDGTQGGVGDMELLGVVLTSPPNGSYQSGDSVPLTVYLVNNGQSPDTLRDVASTSFTGWSASAPSGGSATTPAASSAPAVPGSGTRSVAIPAGSAVGSNMAAIGGQTGTASQAITLTGYKGRSALYPGTPVKITFTFAKAGQLTLTVPVKVAVDPARVTLPGSAPAEG